MTGTVGLWWCFDGEGGGGVPSEDLGVTCKRKAEGGGGGGRCL